MKTTTNILCLFVLATGLFNFTEVDPKFKPSKTASIAFETDVIDYGTIVQHSDGVRLFSFTNTGNAPLLITKVNTSCGCTVPSYSKTPILPGETGQLEILYDTKRLGAFTKTITVLSNAKDGEKRLKIKGVVIAKN